MSKYYKAEDVISFLNMNCPKDMWEYQIADLPTIEVSDEQLSKLQSSENSVENTTASEDFTSISRAKSKLEVSEDAVSREYLKSFEYINKGDFNSVETIREWIDNAPSVIPKPKKGEWTNAGMLTVHCSNCKSEFHELEAMNYCPNCGARMKGKEKIKE